ncbi:glycosyl transferase family 2 [Rhodomicrobium vannielii ATCC 17100]|jgi:glycosyltransferase involved in cell wall biosynthesis|uniref:Glycosyl transferase family 2 n=1 Tax=Rhodomicrobium vannielii (strain ATCC 17100 / DSM 162 / LMG 4299 / NCIMB 10020 / ATH 3.1.1) TaxID=648757 RepID=E3I876_RHOVT|nr:glycosyltransferase [Rhodomicrobium vannielii]ADP69701.1 glycosyl transferase family 2 [Rhodomicrobium vannielii ATCC 17100]
MGEIMEENTERPLITFAVVAYNQAQFVREAINGAFSQTYEPLEIILSDDCSTDQTFEIMQEMAAEYEGPHKIRLRRNLKNLGLAGHINKVIAASSGEIVSWAAGDDIALPNRTEIFVEKLLADPGNVGVHSNVLEINLVGQPIRERLHTSLESTTSLDKVIQRGQSVITQSHAFRKSVFDFFGPFRADLTQEGIAMAFRESSLGKVAFVDQCLTHYRIGCGVSTYSGADINKRRSSEPIKFTNWYLSAFQQMLDDSKSLPYKLSSKQINIIKKNIAFYNNLLEINQEQRIITPLVRNFFMKPRDTKSLRAALRLFLPVSLYRRIAS